MKLLSGKEVYRLSVDQTKLMTKPKAGSSATPRAYFRAKYDGIGFTVDQAFIDSYNKGEIAEITLTEGERTIDDPMVAGAKKTIKSLAFNSFATKTQIKSMTEFEKEIAVIESPSIGNIDLNDDLLAKLQAALTQKQLA